MIAYSAMATSLSPTWAAMMGFKNCGKMVRKSISN
jgi:hypothetical protein